MKCVIFSFIFIFLTLSSYGQAVTLGERETLTSETINAIKINKEMLIKQGGATSGGGDDIGLEASNSLRLIFQMISEEKGEVYSPQHRQHLLSLQKLVKILVVNSNLLVQMNGVTQNSLAYSFNDGENVIILIQSDRWKATPNPVNLEKVLHHELAVLAGLEKTGEYSLTDKFVEMRSLFWQKILSQNFACTFSLFSKKYAGEDQHAVIGKFIGAAGVVKQIDMQSGFVTLTQIGSKLDNGYSPSVIVRYIISADGYLRATISEADVFERNSDFKIFKNLRKSSEEQVYFTPYDLIQPQGAILKPWENYFLQVSCSKI